MILAMILMPFAFSTAAWFVGKKEQNYAYYVALAASAAELLLAGIHALGLLPGLQGPMSLSLVSVNGLRFESDGFRRIYCLVIAFMWFMTLCFSRDYFHGHHRLNRYFFFILMTLGATMGVFLAADLYTAFVFFEIMSFTSFPWVIQEETPGAIRAANTYLAVAVIGGLTALMGIFLLDRTLGTTALSQLFEAAEACERRGVLYAAGGCILFGFGAKAGMFPLHIWLPKAHPVAPAPASALLSGVLTKSGIWGIIAISCNIFREDPAWGALILGLGCITMFLGALLALFSIDLKRTLACSSMSQIGFVLTGIGMMGLLGEENALAARGALLHMMNHSLFKLLLFMCAGAVYMNVHALDLNKVRGFGRKKLFLNLCFLLGAAGIAGIPGLNGYISKTLIHESIAEGAHIYGLPLRIAEWIFLISGGLTLAYMTKLYVCLFIDKPAENAAGHDESPHPAEAETACSETDTQKEVQKETHKDAHIDTLKAGRKSYMSPLSYFAIGGSALVIPVLGLTASVTMNGIADLGTDFLRGAALEHAVRFWSLESLKGAGISILIGASVYALIVRKLMIRNGEYVDLWPKKLDLEDLIYRPLLLTVLPTAFGTISALCADNVVTGALYRTFLRVSGILSRAVSDSLDAVILLLRKTVFRPSRLPVTDKVLQSPAYRMGDLIDRIRRRMKNGEADENSGVGIKAAAGKEEAEHRVARLSFRAWDTFVHTTHNLMDSVSFALFMLCLAIVAVLIYVLFVRETFR